MLGAMKNSVTILDVIGNTAISSIKFSPSHFPHCLLGLSDIQP